MSISKEEKAEYDRQYRAANKDRLAERRRRYYVANRATIIQKQRDYVAVNKDKIAERQAKKYAANKDQYAAKKRLHYLANKERINETNRAYHAAHREKQNAKKIQWQRENKGRYRAYQDAYRTEHRGHINALVRNRNQKRRKTDIQFRLKENLRSRFTQAVRNKHKTGSAVRDLGCSIPELIDRLTDMFQPGMTWDNWGLGPDKWNIDHIKPLSKFDLTDREQFLQAAHYTNLQPLWQEDNLRKGDHSTIILTDRSNPVFYLDTARRKAGCVFAQQA